MTGADGLCYKISLKVNQTTITQNEFSCILYQGFIFLTLSSFFHNFTPVTSPCTIFSLRIFLPSLLFFFLFFLLSFLLFFLLFSIHSFPLFTFSTTKQLKIQNQTIDYDLIRWASVDSGSIRLATVSSLLMKKLLSNFASEKCIKK